jgi:hypothetical protein
VFVVRFPRFWEVVAFGFAGLLPACVVVAGSVAITSGQWLAPLERAVVVTLCLGLLWPAVRLGLSLFWLRPPGVETHAVLILQDLVLAVLLPWLAILFLAGVVASVWLCAVTRKRRKGRGLLRRVAHVPVLLALVLWPLLATGQAVSRSEAGTQDLQLTVYAWASSGEVLDPEVLAVLGRQAARTDVILILRPDDLSSASTRGAEALRALRARGVKTHVMVVEEVGAGVYATEDSADRVLALALQAFSWEHRVGASFSEFWVDAEVPLGTQQVLLGDENQTAGLLSGGAWSGQAAAAETYAELARRARGEGHDLAAAVMPTAVDDAGDGDLSVQDVLDVAPVGANGTTWDHVSVMAYRSAYKQLLGGMDPGPHLVDSYARSTVDHFGANASSVSLGVLGFWWESELGFLHDAYPTVESAVRDVRVAAGAGAQRVALFALHTVVGTWGVAGLEELLTESHGGPAVVSVPFSWLVILTRLGVAVYDAGLPERPW